MIGHSASIAEHDLRCEVDLHGGRSAARVGGEQQCVDRPRHHIGLVVVVVTVVMLFFHRPVVRTT